jgi:hypothetical protein
MSTLSDVIVGLRSALEQLTTGKQHLRRALTNRDQAASDLADALRGASHPDAERAQATLASAREQTETALAATDQAEQKLRAYLRHIQNEPQAAPLADDRVEQTRSSLRHGPDGTQTTGWWLRSDGSRVRIRSGADADPNGWQQKAERFLRRTLPNQPPSLYALSRHVEVQLAIRSHERPFDNEVLVIDRQVCGRDLRTRLRDYTCDVYLPHILAPGAALTVVEHDGTRVTYVGRPHDDDRR